MNGPFGVILAAHGCGDESNANRRVRAMAHDVAARTGLPVAPAFNLGSPGFAEAIDGLEVSSVLVVPLMTSDGYFAREIVPRRCAEGSSAVRKRIELAPPVGMRAEVIESLVGRVAGTVEEFGARAGDTAILVVGHGTRRVASSGDSTRALAERITNRLPGVGARAVFLDQDPLIEDVAPTLDARTVVVLPYLLGGGDHAERDVAGRLGLTLDAGAPPRAVFRDGRRFIFETPLLDQPGLVDAVVAAVEEHRARRPIRLGTRRSRLALWQARRVREAIERVSERPVEIVEIDATGDLDQSAPIETLPGDSPFTDAISDALARGEIDLATHSLKDLPLEPDPRLPVAGVLERGSVEEVLIAREGATLDDLRPGARVGVSCTRRGAQLARLRPDLAPTPIRGPVDRRVGLVLSGRYDAAVLAAAGVERLGLERHVTQRFRLDELTPAAGQGALAVQARADDAEMIALGARLDHEPTRRAVEAELALVRALEGQVDPMVVAADAHVDASGAVVLHGRVVAPDGRLVVDEIGVASDPGVAARNAGLLLLTRLAHPVITEGTP